MIISIITICLNDLTGLRKTYESVVSQKCDDYEHIIVDGNSTDGTKDYLNSIENSRVIWKSEPDKGRSDAFNKGIKMASGEYIICLNAGDYFYGEDVIGDMIKDCANSNVDALCYAVERKDGIVMRCRDENFWKEGLQAHQGLVLSRKVYEELGGYNLILRNRMDYDLFLRLAHYDVSHVLIDRIITIFDTNGISSYDKRNALLEGISLKLQYDKTLSEDEKHFITHFASGKVDSDAKGDNMQKKYALLYNWMLEIMDGLEISNSLIGRGITSISIYGAGQLGSLLFKNLSNSNVKIKEIVDRKQGITIWGRKSIALNEMSCDVDAVIVTVIDDYEDIRKKLLDKFHDIRVIALKDLVAGKQNG